MRSPALTRAAAIIGIVGVLVVASLVVRLILGGGLAGSATAPEPGVSGTAGASTSQRTLLLQATDESGRAVANVLLGASTAHDAGTELLLPPELLLPTPTPVPISMTTESVDTLQARNGVTALLGVQVDASLVLDRLALAALVDGVGGVPLEIRDPVQEFDDRGRLVAVIPAGARVLDGVTAATYALTLQPGESEDARMSRFRDVFEQVLRDLPGERDAMRQLLLSLGSLAKSTATNDELVDITLALQADAAADAVDVRHLPVVIIRAGRAAVMERPVGPQLAAALFPGSLAPSGSPSAPVVQVWAAGASAAQVALALDAISGASATAVAVGRTDPARSRVLVPNSEASTIAFATTVAQALGLDGSHVVVDSGAALADVVQVLVGSDLPAL